MKSRTSRKLLIIGVIINIGIYASLYLWMPPGSSLNQLSGVWGGETQCYSKPLPEDKGNSLVGPTQHHLKSGATCDVNAAPTDIQMLEVLRSKVRFTYPSYLFTVSGFMQVFDPPPLAAALQRPLPLTVIVLPHSHNDPGWLNTFDAYYRDDTRHVLNTMVKKLSSSLSTTFIWPEMVFLEWWFRESSTDQQLKLKELVASGRWELATGGWVMPDEASTTAYAVLEQLIEGHWWINDTFGKDHLPQRGWSIDPFGHSASVPYLLRLGGVRDIMIQRAHFAVKRYLAHTQQLQFHWKLPWDEKESSLCHVHPFLGYSITLSCGPNPHVCCQLDWGKNRCERGWGDTPSAAPITQDNVANIAQQVVSQLRRTSQFFKTPVLLLPHGDDFRYRTLEEADNQLDNLERLMRHISDDPSYDVKMRFGTLKDFFSEVKEQNVPLPSLSGDFFPYSDRADQHWSGVFTSRPWLKYTGRQLETRIRAAHVLLTQTARWMIQLGHAPLPNVTSLLLERLRSARRELALFQHHDAITGTAREHVATDYFNRLVSGLKDAGEVLKLSVGLLTSLSTDPHSHAQDFVLAEEWRGDSTAPELFVVGKDYNAVKLAVYNPLQHSRQAVLRFRTRFKFVSVSDARGSDLPVQLNPVLSPLGHLLKDQFEVLFSAALEPLGLHTFTVTQTASITNEFLAQLTLINSRDTHIPSGLPFSTRVSSSEEWLLQNNVTSAIFASCDGMLQGIRDKRERVGGTQKARLELVSYSTGSKINPFQDKSGAYIFLPDGPAQKLKGNRPTIVKMSGPVAEEAVVFHDLIQLRYTLVSTQGPEAYSMQIKTVTDISKRDNLELGLRLYTDVHNSDGSFYTDSNAFQTMKRQRLSNLPIQGNFYPVTSWSFLDDGHQRVSLLTAQPHGVSSLAEGQLEVMLDRRLLQDDWRGLKEGLRDSRRSLASFCLVMERRSTPSQLLRESAIPSLTPLTHPLSLTLNHPPLVLHFRPQHPGLDAWRTFTPAPPLPCTLHLVTLRPLAQTDFKASLAVYHAAGLDCSFPVPSVQGPGWCGAADVHPQLPVKNLLGHLPYTSLDVAFDLLGSPQTNIYPTRADGHHVIKAREMTLLRITWRDPKS